MLIKMDWTSIYLKTANLNVFVLGTGEVATRRANKFLDHGANVKLAGDVLDKELINKGAVLASVDDVVNLVQWSDVVVIASGDRELSDYVSKIAEDKLLNRADFPDNGNIIVPTSFNIGDVEYAILETSGEINVILKPEKRNPTLEDMELSAKYEGITYDLVIDGVIQYDNLNKLNKDYTWLEDEVSKFGFEPEDALIVTIDGNNNIFCQQKGGKRCQKK